MNHEESVLYASLTDVEAVDQLARTGLSLECVPTEGMRDVVQWALTYFYRSGRLKAPSREMITAEWGARLEQCDVTLPEDDEQVDDVTWAVDMLKSQHVLAESQRLQRQIAISIHNAEPGERVAAAAQGAEEWHRLALSVRDRTNETEGVRGIEDSLARYDQRAASGQAVTGLRLGIDAIDQHTLGIHPGEIAIWAAGPKGGKSWSLSKAGINEWESGRETVLYTLENTVAMTMDRIACQLCAVDYRDYQKGRASEEEIQRIKDFLATRAPEMRETLHVISPEPGRRTPAALIQHAQAIGAKSVIIDQLTHVEHPNPGRKGRPEIVRDIMQGFATLITSDRNPLPLLMAHQFNREGVKYAKAHDSIEPEHLAEGAEVERSASLVIGLLRSETEQRIGQARALIIASRRQSLKSWRLAFEPWYGIQEAREEITR